MQASSSKPCRRCGEVKPLAEFYENKRMADGHLNVCKPCDLAGKKLRYQANPLAHSERMKRWRSENAEALRKAKREYAVANREKINARSSEYAKAYRQANLERIRARDNARAKKPEYRAMNAANQGRRRTGLPWQDAGSIEAVYRTAQAMTTQTGEKHHVDHIIPLKHRLVCGLHVARNMRVVSAAENLRKHNKFEVI